MPVEVKRNKIHSMQTIYNYIESINEKLSVSNDIKDLYKKFNREYFDGMLPDIEIKINNKKVKIMNHVKTREEFLNESKTIKPDSIIRTEEELSEVDNLWKLIKKRKDDVEFILHCDPVYVPCIYYQREIDGKWSKSSTDGMALKNNKGGFFVLGSLNYDGLNSPAIIEYPKGAKIKDYANPKWKDLTTKEFPEDHWGTDLSRLIKYIQDNVA